MIGNGDLIALWRALRRCKSWAVMEDRSLFFYSFLNQKSLLFDGTLRDGDWCWSLEGRHAVKAASYFTTLVKESSEICSITTPF